MRRVSPLVLVVVGIAQVPFESQCLAQEFRQRAVLRARAGGAMSLAFSPDGKTLASGHGGIHLKLWNVATAKDIATIGYNEAGETLFGTLALVFSPDGATLGIANSHADCWLWNIHGAKKTRSFQVADRGIPLAFRPDLKMAASLSKETVPPGEFVVHVDLWDVTTGKRLTRLKGHTIHVEALAFSPDGKTLASGGGDNLIKLWDVASFKNTLTIAGHKRDLMAVVFSPDGKTLASVGNDKTVKLWEVATGQLRAAFQGHVGPYASLAFRPDGKTLAVGGSPDNTVAIWDLSSGQLVATLKGHTKPVFAVAFSPDGKTLASGSLDTTIKLWDVSVARGER